MKEKMAKGYTVGEAGVPYAHSPKADQVSGILPQPCDSIERDEVQWLIEDAQPVYLAVRDDIDQEECTVDQLKWKQSLQEVAA